MRAEPPDGLRGVRSPKTTIPIGETDMANADRKAIYEAEVHALFDDRLKAVRMKDVDKLMSGYAPDVLSFDVVDPLQYAGSDGIRARMEEWFSSFEGPISLENLNLTIAAGEDVAFCHSLSHVNAITTGGGHLEMWWRETVCYRRIDSKWMITHQHSSVPFNVKSGKASLDLKP
jgi:ketosteroid isomerase-like protein